MKRLCIIALLAALVPLSSYAQGLYFDIGLGAGQATTKLNSIDVSGAFSSSATEIGVDISCKIGYGPIAGIPLYVIGEFGGIGHRFEESGDYIQFNSYLLGPGIIIYPVPFIQLAASGGLSFVSNQTNLPVIFYDSDEGYAYNISCALDIGRGNSGWLIGGKYSYTKNTLEISGTDQESSLISLFVKYAYRLKR